MNPFSVLGIDEDADDAAIRAAYLRGVRRSPPDRDPDGFRRVRDAYEAIQDAERRLASRLFGPAPAPSLEGLAGEFPDERRFVGPEPWLRVLRGDRR